MEEYQEENERQQNQEGNSSPGGGLIPSRWLGLAVIALLLVSGISLGYAYHQRVTVHDLEAQASASNSAVVQMQNQVNSLTAKLNEITVAQATHAATPVTSPEPEVVSENSTNVAENPVAPAPSAKSSAIKHPAAKRKVPTDKRYTQLQAQLVEQQKQLKDTQDQVEKYRSDLQGNINSTRDELNGSIAKTHEELVALEKRGERSYYEFDLAKSKQFQRVGPLSISLRKADTKHKSYDLAMIVDDNQLAKKQVNLYEPITIHTENGAQPLMVVVNRIEKNLVHGYISAPKYKPSELAASSASSVAPVAGNAPAANDNHNSQQPPPQQ